MSQWDSHDDGGNVPGPGGVLLLMGLALGAAAAALLTTKEGRQVRDQIAQRAGDWTAQAAGALAQGREKLIASVEEQTAPRPDDRPAPVRERPR